MTHRVRGGEVRVRIPGVCLSPSRFRELAVKGIKRKSGWGILPRPRLRKIAEEMLYVPYYFFRLVNPKYRGRFYLYQVLVDGILGFSEFIRGPFQLREVSVPEDLILERTISREEAETKARKAVASFVLRRQSLWVREVKVELIEEGDLHFPYFVCYLEGEEGIDLLALNGLTGSLAGPRPENILRAGIARAEWRRDRS
jgi:hypothetical protein